MKTFEEAKKIAVKNNKNVNACREYKEAYVFYDKGYSGDGGERAPIAVMKSDGKVKSMPQFMRSRKEEDAGKAKAFNAKTPAKAPAKKK